MENWNFGRRKGVNGQWPVDDMGEQIPPVFLVHLSDSHMEAEITRNMLASFGIPTVCRYPNDGEFGSVIMGNHSGGVDIFVPETQMEDAENILNSDPQSDTIEEQETE
jgi:hypothetical protein